MHNDDTMIIIVRILELHINYRIECFDYYFPCNEDYCNNKHFINWFKM